MGIYNKIDDWEHDFIYLAYPIFYAEEIAKFLERSADHIRHITSYNGWFKQKKIKPLMRFGHLLTIEFLKNNDTNLKWKWKCQCDCGNECYVPTSYLNCGQKTCGCIYGFKTEQSEHCPYWFYKSSEDNAKIRNLKFEVNINYLSDLLKQQDFKCALTKVPIRISEKNYRKKYNITTASLDRIDNNLGYIEGNVQFLHKNINKLKHVFTQEFLIIASHLIAKNNPYNGKLIIPNEYLWTK